MDAEPIDFSICITSLGEGGLFITASAENFLLLCLFSLCLFTCYFKVKVSPTSKVIKVKLHKVNSGVKENYSARNVIIEVLSKETSYQFKSEFGFVSDLSEEIIA